MNKRNFFIRFSAFHGKIRIFGKIRRAVPPSRFSAQQSAMQARQDHIRVPKLGVICGFGTAIGLSGASVAYPCAKTGCNLRFRHGNRPLRRISDISVCQNWHRRRKVASPAATARALRGALGKGSLPARLLPCAETIRCCPA